MFQVGNYQTSNVYFRFRYNSRSAKLHGSQVNFTWCNSVTRATPRTTYCVPHTDQDTARTESLHVRSNLNLVRNPVPQRSKLFARFDQGFKSVDCYLGFCSCNVSRCWIQPLLSLGETISGSLQNRLVKHTLTRKHTADCCGIYLSVQMGNRNGFLGEYLYRRIVVHRDGSATN